MLIGFGWCVLCSCRESNRPAGVDSVEALDSEMDLADRVLWASFRRWMTAHEEPFLKWQLHEQFNNHTGLLQFCVSRNHRATVAWEMLKWIAENAPGSYGLFYVHDDEDQIGAVGYGRGNADFSHEFRVHRIANGTLSEHPDPYLSPIVRL